MKKLLIASLMAAAGITNAHATCDWCSTGETNVWQNASTYSESGAYAGGQTIAGPGGGLSFTNVEATSANHSHANAQGDDWWGDSYSSTGSHSEADFTSISESFGNAASLGEGAGWSGGDAWANGGRSWTDQYRYNWR